MTNDRLYTFWTEDLLADSFEVGDRVKVKQSIFGEGKLGTIISTDRQRFQWQVRLDSGAGEYWYNSDELIRVAKDSSTTIHNTSNNPEAYSFCRHELKLYTGLTEQFNYCVKCGKSEKEI